MALHRYRYIKALLDFLFSKLSLAGVDGHWILILSEMLPIPPQHWQQGSWYKPAASAVPHNGNIQLTLKQFSSYWNHVLFRRSPSVNLTRLSWYPVPNPWFQPGSKFDKRSEIGSLSPDTGHLVLCSFWLLHSTLLYRYYYYSLIIWEELDVSWRFKIKQRNHLSFKHSLVLKKLLNF